MRRYAPILALAVLLLAGCGGKAVQVSSTAVRQAALGSTTTTVVTLSSDDVGRLAAQAGVSNEAISQVAPRLDEQLVWQRSLQGAKTVYEQTPGEIRSNLFGIACKYWRGELNGEGDLVGEIKQRFRALSHDELQALTAAALGLWSELEEAAQSDDPHARASAALTCFTIEQVTD